MNIKDDKAPVLSIFNSLIKNHDLNSQYFLDWLFVNFQPNDLYWHSSAPSLNNKEINAFSISGFGSNTTIGTFEEKDGAIFYKLNKDIIFENSLLNNLIKNTVISESQEDESLLYENSIFGSFRLRISRVSNFLAARILFLKWPKSEFNIHYYIVPLRIIIEHFNKKIIFLTEEQKQEIEKLYYSFIQNKLDFNNLDNALFLIDEYEKFSKLIDY